MTGQKKSRAAGMKKKPIRLVYRQIDPIHAMDKHLMGATTRRRYASWPRAYKAMLKFAEEYPMWEWWLQEDLVRRGPHSWSQMCADCEWCNSRLTMSPAWLGASGAAQRPRSRPVQPRPSRCIWARNNAMIKTHQGFLTWPRTTIRSLRYRIAYKADATRACV